MSEATLYLVAPSSLMSWLSHFVDPKPGDVLYHIGETEDFDADAILGLAKDTAATVILSSHDTLHRDLDLADKLRWAGHQVIVQSECATVLGTDKVAMKRFFDNHGFPTAPWRYGDEGTLRATAGDVVVVKGRNSTQSQGMWLTTGAVDTSDSFVELYSDGVEYSLLAYRLNGRCVTLPAVWKGPTSAELTPPWKRLRLCPAPELSAELEARMRDLTVSIAQAADICGYLEVEFLVDTDGSMLVLEINPRVSGTLRIAAMASNVPVFSLHKPLSGRVIASQGFAAEFPYQGPNFNAPQDRVFATSRLTVAGNTPADVVTTLMRYRIEVNELLPDPWTAVSSHSAELAREDSAT